MAGGQQINSAQGTLTALGGDNNAAATGQAATATAGSIPDHTHAIGLKSKKVGGGTAQALLNGQQIALSQGAVGYAEAYALTGQSITVSPGILLFRGQVTISWNAVTTNSDGSPASDIAGYRILHGTTSGVYNGADTVNLGLATSYVYGGLLPGFTHYFVVQARDNAGQFSANSTEAAKAFIAVSPGGFVEAQGT